MKLSIPISYISSFDNSDNGEESKKKIAIAYLYILSNEWEEKTITGKLSGSKGDIDE